VEAVAVADHEASTALRRTYAPEHIERGLWAIAVSGGSPTKAARLLEEEEFFPFGAEEGPIPRASLEYWKKVSHRNRYAQILKDKSDKIDDVIAENAQALSLAIASAEDQALKRTIGGISMANGIEASQILFNLSRVKGIQNDIAGGIRDRPAQAERDKSLKEIARSLESLGGGVIQIEDAEIVEEAEVVEDVIAPKKLGAVGAK